MWGSVKRTIQYIVGCGLCLIGIVAAFGGQLTASKNGGPAHTVHYGQFIVGGAFFLVGVLFIVAAKRSAKRSRRAAALPAMTSPLGGSEGRGIPAVRNEGFEFDSNEQRWRPKGEMY